MQIGSSLDGMVQRSVLDVLRESLHDRPHVMGAENEVRYKLIIDPSEDDSLVRLLFTFGVLERDKTYLYMCSDFPSDGQSQKVSYSLTVSCITAKLILHLFSVLLSR